MKFLLSIIDLIIKKKLSKAKSSYFESLAKKKTTSEKAFLSRFLRRKLVVKIVNAKERRE